MKLFGQEEAHTYHILFLLMVFLVKPNLYPKLIALWFLTITYVRSFVRVRSKNVLYLRYHRINSQKRTKMGILTLGFLLVSSDLIQCLSNVKSCQVSMLVCLFSNNNFLYGLSTNQYFDALYKMICEHREYFTYAWPENKWSDIRMKSLSLMHKVRYNTKQIERTSVCCLSVATVLFDNVFLLFSFYHSFKIHCFLLLNTCVLLNALWKLPILNLCVEKKKNIIYGFKNLRILQ